ncbi:TPA: hypothetical protein EYP26_05015 [Candidatus Bathyarchaeota archaeon]|nr:hypothetical protein [Candidatus Bathyarchaeota archaeon]
MKPILKYALLAVVLASLAIGAILAQRSSLILPGADKKPEKLEAPLKGLVKVRSEGGSVEEYAKALLINCRHHEKNCFHVTW